MSRADKIRKGLTFTLKFPDGAEYLLKALSPFKFEAVKVQLGKKFKFDHTDAKKWNEALLKHPKEMMKPMLEIFMVDPKLGNKSEGDTLTIEDIPVIHYQYLLQSAAGLNPEVVASFRPEVKVTGG